MLHFIYAHRYVRISFIFDASVWKDIIQRSWPLIITIVLNLVYLKADILILSLFKSQADVGLYGAAYRVIDVLVTIPFMIGGTILPILLLVGNQKIRKAINECGNESLMFQQLWPGHL